MDYDARTGRQQVAAQDKPQSYWVEHQMQVLTYIRQKLAQNPQEEKEKWEWDDEKPEID